jgi:hypothetical protein
MDMNIKKMEKLKVTVFVAVADSRLPMYLATR